MRERIDLGVAVALAAGILCWETAFGGLAAKSWTVTAFVLLMCAAVAIARRRPLASAVVAAGALTLVGLAGQGDSLTGAMNALELVPLAVAYLLGLEESVAAGLAGVVLLAAGLQALGGPFNPLFEMVTLGPWLAGRAVGARRRLAAQIVQRNHELEVERAAFERESVRYERARIARELHDAVGHCVSVIVVQAGAGQRLAAAEPERSKAAFEAILEAAAEAGAELALLTAAPADRAGHSLAAIDDLVRRAAATGVEVRYVAAPDSQMVGAEAADAAYRVVQEGLTNSLKHAPGAPIDVELCTVGDAVEVSVTTAPGTTSQAGSGGRGLAGMAARVAECGGTLSAGPGTAGGWRLAARLPTTASGANLSAQVWTFDGCVRAS